MGLGAGVASPSAASADSLIFGNDEGDFVINPSSPKVNTNVGGSMIRNGGVNAKRKATFYDSVWTVLDVSLTVPRTTAAVVGVDDRIFVMGGAPSLKSIEMLEDVDYTMIKPCMEAAAESGHIQTVDVLHGVTPYDDDEADGKPFGSVKTELGMKESPTLKDCNGDEFEIELEFQLDEVPVSAKKPFTSAGGVTKNTSPTDNMSAVSSSSATDNMSAVSTMLGGSEQIGGSSSSSCPPSAASSSSSSSSSSAHDSSDVDMGMIYDYSNSADVQSKMIDTMRFGSGMSPLRGANQNA